MSKEKETGKEKGRIRQLARYYIPYKGLFFTDMFFAMLGAAITLVIPLIVRYITSTVVEKPLEQATGEDIYAMAQDVRLRVKNCFGVKLEPEVAMV